MGGGNPGIGDQGSTGRFSFCQPINPPLRTNTFSKPDFFRCLAAVADLEPVWQVRIKIFLLVFSQPRVIFQKFLQWNILRIRQMCLLVLFGFGYIHDEVVFALQLGQVKSGYLFYRPVQTG